MNAVFIKLFDVSIVASISIILALLFRPLLKKCPSFIRCILWCVILLRLLLPFTINSSVFTMQKVPSANDIFVQESVAKPEQPPISQAPVVDVSKAPVFEDTASAIVPDISVAPPINNDAPTITTPDTEDIPSTVPQNTEKKSVSVLTVLSIVWAVGVAIMLLYMAISSIVLRVKTRSSIVYDSRIRIINAKTSPFIRGIIHPTIYIPADLDKSSWPHIIAHENAHLKRLDHLVKPVAFVALAVHWFNPLVWVAYIMLCKDIEYACDEKAVKEMDHAEKQKYSLSLLSCAAGKALAFAHPLAFGKVSVKERIKRIMNYKISVWAICLALIVSMLLGLLLACSPGGEDASSADGTSEETAWEQSKYFGSLIETTDENGRKGYILKVSEWAIISQKITNEFIKELKADFLAIWEDSDFVTVDFGTDSITLNQDEYELPGYGHGYKAVLTTSFNSYSFVLYDINYGFKHIKAQNGKLTFEKASAFGEAVEYDTNCTANLEHLLFIRLIYGLKPDSERVRNYSITSGVYSDAATIVISPTHSVVCWRGLSVEGHWWINLSDVMRVTYSRGSDLKKDKANTELTVLEYDDGGNEIVKIIPSTYAKNFKFISIEYDENSNPKVGKVLYEANMLNSKQPFYAKTEINEGLPFRGVIYTDSLGFTFYARIMLNPKDGGLYLELFAPSGDVPNQPVYTKSKMVRTQHKENPKLTNCASAFLGSSLIYRFDTANEFNSFKADLADVLNFDSEWGECKSFNAEMAEYTNAFFEDNTLILIYFTTNSGSFRFSIEGNIENEKTLAIKITKTVDPPYYTMDNAAWFGVLAFSDSEIKNCTEYRRVLNDQNYTPTEKEYNVANVNHSNSKAIYTEALNKAVFTGNNPNNLPIYRITGEDEENAFKNTFNGIFEFEFSLGDTKSLNAILEQYDASFYENSSLIMVYVPSADSSIRYEIKNIAAIDESIIVYVKPTALPETGTDTPTGWIIAIGINNTPLENCNVFNAIMVE